VDDKKDRADVAVTRVLPNGTVHKVVIDITSRQPNVDVVGALGPGDAAVAGYWAKVSEDGKRSQYSSRWNIQDNEFYACGIETNGRLGDGAMDMVEVLAATVSRALMSKPGAGKSARFQQQKRILIERISVAFQKGNAAIARTFRCKGYPTKAAGAAAGAHAVGGAGGGGVNPVIAVALVAHAVAAVVAAGAPPVPAA